MEKLREIAENLFSKPPPTPDHYTDSSAADVTPP